MTLEQIAELTRRCLPSEKVEANQQGGDFITIADGQVTIDQVSVSPEPESYRVTWRTYWHGTRDVPIDWAGQELLTTHDPYAAIRSAVMSLLEERVNDVLIAHIDEQYAQAVGKAGGKSVGE